MQLIFFWSLWFNKIKLHTNKLIIINHNKIVEVNDNINLRKIVWINNPYLPIFRRMAAKIMEPVTIDSTCALGNHRCTKYNGNFLINTIKTLIDIMKDSEPINLV